MVAAVAKAAHDVLVSRLSIPTVNAVSAPLIAQVDTAYANYLINNGLAVNDPGVAVGQQAALNIILNRANDGSFPANPEIFTGSTEPGQWRPTPPAFLPMAGTVDRRRDAVRAEGPERACCTSPGRRPSPAACTPATTTR